MARKLKTPDEIDYRIQIYPPSGQHNKFRVIKLYKGTGKSETIYDSEIDEINLKFLEHIITQDVARSKLESVVDKLYASDGVLKVELTIHPDNLKVLNSYWKEVYSHKHLEDERSARAEHERAIKCLGDKLLRRNTQAELQKIVDKNAEGNKHRRAVAKINSLLRFVGRDFVLEADRRQHRNVRYITIEDLPKLLENIPPIESVSTEAIKNLHEVAFYTGTLIGEAFALNSKTYRADDDTIKISEQIDKLGKKKAGRLEPRTTVVMPEGREALLRWFRVQKSVPLELRVRMSRLTRKASMAAFKDPSKHITFLDLRHSYAMHLLRKGIPLNIVAELLGISENAAKELYGNFDTPGSALDFVKDKLKSS